MYKHSHALSLLLKTKLVSNLYGKSSPVKSGSGRIWKYLVTSEFRRSLRGTPPRPVFDSEADINLVVSGVVRPTQMSLLSYREFIWVSMECTEDICIVRNMVHVYNYIGCSEFFCNLLRLSAPLWILVSDLPINTQLCKNKSEYKYNTVSPSAIYLFQTKHIRIACGKDVNGTATHLISLNLRSLSSMQYQYEGS